ncbi:MAG: hypothetical protein FJ104_06380 [Deltaproteobacteria bacterium]|nr:hypothetical protein [Deltaproteobacteria bacterium]
MGVDGIGSGRPPGGLPSVDPAGSAGGVAPGDRVTGARSDGVAAAGSAELGRLERGELTLPDYLEARVVSATQHLEGRLPQAELTRVRDGLRAELASDPVTAELVRRLDRSLTRRAGA